MEAEELEEAVFVSSPNRMLRVSKELKKLHFSNPGEKMKGSTSARRHRGLAGVVSSHGSVLVEDGQCCPSQDVCDCLDTSCPGCYLPCSKCRSNKCGVVCRQRRTWQYVQELPGEHSP